MYGVEGQESWNFFKNDFTNHIGPATSAALLALSDWSFYGENGEAVASPVFPYMLRFHPTGELSFADEYHGLFTEDLVSIDEGSTLYEVWAMDQPTELGGTETHIANLVLDSQITTSKWGDKHLYFRHQDMWDDIDLVPEWYDYTETFGLGLSRCPFKH